MMKLPLFLAIAATGLALTAFVASLIPGLIGLQPRDTSQGALHAYLPTAACTPSAPTAPATCHRSRLLRRSRGLSAVIVTDHCAS